MSRHAYVYLPARSLVFYSYKAGNTSLGEWIFDLVAPRNLDAGLIPSKRRYLSSVNCNVHFRDALDLIENHGFHGVVLTRNPYSRALSAFMNKFVVDRKRWLDQPRKLEKFAVDLLERAGKDVSPEAVAGSDAAFQGISFVDFLGHIASAVSTAEAGREPRLNDHWNTQVPLHFDGRKYFERQLRLENIDADLKLLAQDWGVGAGFPQLRKTNEKIGIRVDGDLSEVPSAEIARQRILPDYNNLMSEKARELIKIAYAIDFRTYGYPP